MKIIIAGGTGFIGSELIRRLLDAKNNVILLSRNPDTGKSIKDDSFQIVKWDGKTMGEWARHIDGVDAIINLTGENIAAKRWSEKQKTRLLQSRIEPTRAIVNAISEASCKQRILINASAVGYYGNFGTGDVTEAEPRGVGFLSDLCEQWEREAMYAEKYKTRVVLLRIGVALDPSGGALKRMLLPFRLFIGGPLGSGKQWFPWIHREDVVNIIFFALEKQSLSGEVNVSSPSPVMMNEFSSSLGKAIGRPSWMPVPSFMLKLMLGEMSEMLIGGRRIIPKKLLEAGYKFKFPTLHDALENFFG
ncbi:MAG: TIGR01777 family oxidoreductase [Bacteroidota bacterium]|nr:TIGR01777 family oxidoreductase [Bacteroidota bacterium]